MAWQNRIGIYGSYFLGMAAIGFTLPYLPLSLRDKGLSDRAIGSASTLRRCQLWLSFRLDSGPTGSAGVNPS